MHAIHTNKKVHIIEILVLLVVLMAFFRHFNSHSFPSIYNDEFGYWASAAYLNGYDWSKVFSITPYYSVGYGIIIALIWKIIPDITIVYRFILFLNYVWLIGSFFLIKKTIKKLYPDEPFYIYTLVSLCSICIPSNFIQVNYTWPEIFLFLIFCAITYTVVCVIQHSTLLNCSLLALLLGINYIIHQRTVALCIAGTCVMLLLASSRQISVRNFIVYCLILIICLQSAFYLKDYIVNGVWNNSSTIQGNSFSGQTEKLQFILSVKGIIHLLTSAAAKVFYIIILTGGLIYFSIFKFIENILKKPFNRKENFYSIFCLLCFAGTIGISAIGMIIPVTDTQLMYGRYTENILAPYIAVSVIELLKAENKFKNIILGIWITFICAIASIILKKISGSYYITIINSVGIINYITDYSVNIGKACIAVTFMSIFFAFFIKLRKNKKMYSIIFSILLISFWAKTGEDSYQLWEETGWEAAYESSNIIADVILETESAQNPVKIYAISQKGFNYPEEFSGNGIQFLLPDKEISYITYETAEQIIKLENCLIILPVEMGFSNDFRVLMRTKEFYLLAKK